MTMRIGSRSTWKAADLTTPLGQARRFHCPPARGSYQSCLPKRAPNMLWNHLHSLELSNGDIVLRIFPQWRRIVWTFLVRMVRCIVGFAYLPVWTRAVDKDLQTRRSSSETRRMKVRKRRKKTSSFRSSSVRCSTTKNSSRRSKLFHFRLPDWTKNSSRWNPRRKSVARRPGREEIRLTRDTLGFNFMRMCPSLMDSI